MTLLYIQGNVNKDDNRFLVSNKQWEQEQWSNIFKVLKEKKTASL